MHLHGPPSSLTPLHSSRDPYIAWASFFIVYSIPIVLCLTIVCIIKWRPLREFPNLKRFCRWYCSCSAKQVLEELDQVDRTRMIMPIDAESLVSLNSICDLPLLLQQSDCTAIP